MSRFQRERLVGVCFGSSRLQIHRIRYNECTRPPKTSKVTNEGVICAILALAQAGRGVWHRNAAAADAAKRDKFGLVTLLLAAALRLMSIR